MRLLLLMILLLGCAPAVSAGTVLNVGPFDAIELRNGGQVVVRHGPARRVTLVEGDASIVRVAVDNGRLRIDHCRDCRHDRRMKLEVVVPALTALSIESGGTIVVADGFPDQPDLALAVAHGGRIDARALAADAVAAAVAQGGLIYTAPRRRLGASVNQGGMIFYWGDPSVTPAISGGGGVVRGRPEDRDLPLGDLQPQPPPHPPVAPVPPVPPVPGGGR